MNWQHREYWSGLAARVDVSKLLSALLALGMAITMIFVVIWITRAIIDPKLTPVQQAQAAMTPLVGEQVLFPEGWHPVGCDVTGGGRYSSAKCTWVCANGDAEYRICVPAFVPNERDE